MKALLLIDFINEIVDPKGTLAAKGYADYIQEHDIFKNVNSAIETFRRNGDMIIFIRLAFDSSYHDQPKKSPLFGKANEFDILKDGTWSSGIHASLDYRSDDYTIVKKRVSAFHDTNLATLLRLNAIHEIYVAGVATDLAVEATARHAHDLDFAVNVVADACAAATTDDHDHSIAFLSKIARVVAVDEL